MEASGEYQGRQFRDGMTRQEGRGGQLACLFSEPNYLYYFLERSSTSFIENLVRMGGLGVSPMLSHGCVMVGAEFCAPSIMTRL